MKRQLHVAVFNPTAFGGHARYAHELLTAVTELGGAALRVSLVTNRDLEPPLRDAPYRIFNILPPLAPLDTFRTPIHWAVARVLHYRRRDSTLLSWVREQGDVDLVHYQLPPLLPGPHYRAMKAAGPRVAVTVHNVVPHRYRVPLLRPIQDRLSISGWRSCDLLFVHSDGLRVLLSERLGGTAPPILVSPHGRWSVGQTCVPPVTDRLALKTLLLFGVQRRNKGLHVMLDALRDLPGLRLVLAGLFEDQRLYTEVQARIEAERLPVELVNRHILDDEVDRLFARATLAVLPYTDFFAESGVLHLAVSHRVPVVVTDVGALGETVRREEVGVVVPPRDPAAFAAGVQAALDAVGYAAAVRSCEVVTQLGWREAAQATLDGYRRLVPGFGA